MSSDLSAIAYHEAGHAVAAVLLGGEIVQVTLEPENDGSLPDREGEVSIRWHHAGKSRRELISMEITVCLAGPAAEMLYEGQRPHPSAIMEWRFDWECAWSLAGQLVADSSRRLLMLETILSRLCGMFDRDDCWQAIAETADQLEAFETLEGDQVKEIVHRWVELD